MLMPHFNGSILKYLLTEIKPCWPIPFAIKDRQPVRDSVSELFKTQYSRYSQSSPCDHSHKRPALVTTTFVKHRLNFACVQTSPISFVGPFPRAPKEVGDVCTQAIWTVNYTFVMKSSFVKNRSRKRPQTHFGLRNWTFSLFLSSRKRPLTVSFIKINTLNKLHTALMA